jgi:cytochrome c biogenesis protein CcdA
MAREVLLAAFIIAVGLCVAGAGTHFYQWRLRQQAMLRYDGSTMIASMGHLVMSFFCGPYIMLQMGWSPDNGNTVNTGSALLSALVAFGWAFITGLMIMGTYVALRS